MKSVVWEDEGGFKRRVLLKESDGLDKIRYGIPVVFPDFQDADLEGMLREMNNVAVQENVRTYAELLRHPSIMQTFMNIVKRHVVSIYTNSNNSHDQS